MSLYSAASGIQLLNMCNLSVEVSLVWSFSFLALDFCLCFEKLFLDGALPSVQPHCLGKQVRENSIALATALV